MSETNPFNPSKPSKIWLACMVLIAIISLVCTHYADKKYYEKHPINPVVPTEIVDSVHNAARAAR